MVRLKSVSPYLYDLELTGMWGLNTTCHVKHAVHCAVGLKIPGVNHDTNHLYQLLCINHILYIWYKLERNQNLLFKEIHVCLYVHIDKNTPSVITGLSSPQCM